MLEIRYEAKRLSEKFVMWVAWHLPKKLVYWCTIRLMAHATTDQYSGQIVPELLAMDVLKRWDTA